MISFHNRKHHNIDLYLSTRGRHREGVIFLIVIAVLAFFPLALAFGRDSRPHDPHQRRWL
jgi:hypothetical protein